MGVAIGVLPPKNKPIHIISPPPPKISKRTQLMITKRKARNILAKIIEEADYGLYREMFLSETPWSTNRFSVKEIKEKRAHLTNLLYEEILHIIQKHIIQTN